MFFPLNCGVTITLFWYDNTGRRKPTACLDSSPGELGSGTFDTDMLKESYQTCYHADTTQKHTHTHPQTHTGERPCPDRQIPHTHAKRLNKHTHTEGSLSGVRPSLWRIPGIFFPRQVFFSLNSLWWTLVWRRPLVAARWNLPWVRRLWSSSSVVSDCLSMVLAAPQSGTQRWQRDAHRDTTLPESAPWGGLFPGLDGVKHTERNLRFTVVLCQRCQVTR